MDRVPFNRFPLQDKGAIFVVQPHFCLVVVVRAHQVSVHAAGDDALGIVLVGEIDDVPQSRGVGHLQGALYVIYHGVDSEDTASDGVRSDVHESPHQCRLLPEGIIEGNGVQVSPFPEIWIGGQGVFQLRYAFVEAFHENRVHILDVVRRRVIEPW